MPAALVEQSKAAGTPAPGRFHPPLVSVRAARGERSKRGLAQATYASSSRAVARASSSGGPGRRSIEPKSPARILRMVPIISSRRRHRADRRMFWKVRATRSWVIPSGGAVMSLAGAGSCPGSAGTARSAC